MKTVYSVLNAWARHTPIAAMAHRPEDKKTGGHEPETWGGIERNKMQAS